MRQTFTLSLLALSILFSGCYTQRPNVKYNLITGSNDAALHNDAVKAYPKWEAWSNLGNAAIITGGGAVICGFLFGYLSTPYRFSWAGVLGASLIGGLASPATNNIRKEKKDKIFTFNETNQWIDKYNKTNKTNYVVVGEDINEKDEPYLILVPSIRKDRYLQEENRRRESRNGRE